MPKFMPIDQEDSMSTLSRMVVNTNFEDLPIDVINYAKHSILDTMACIVGGSAMEGIPAVVDLVKSRGGRSESIIPFYGGKVPASEAGLAIGPMARAMDLGGVHEEAAHCSEYTVPVLLAAIGLKEKVPGKEIITAFTVGQEVLVRIGLAFKGMSRGIPLGRSTGHHIFGAVASVAKLLGMNLEDLKNAEGIASCMTQPHNPPMYKPATLMVRIHHGFVCQDAINACLLAKRAITGPTRDVVRAPWGYLGFAKWETDPDAVTKDLGEEWEMLNTMLKPYSSCKFNDTAIDGILGQMKEYKFKPEDIANIDIDESSCNWMCVCIPKEGKWNPQTVYECQFSLPYAVATAVYDKDIFLEAYTPDAMTRQEVRDLMTRISAREEPSLPPFAARVNTTLKDGRKYSKESIYIKGHRKNPLSEQEVIAKFRRCVPYSAYKLNETVVDSVIEALLNLEKVDDVVDAIILPLTPR